LKCNVDASFHPHQGASSLGACIRDERRVFVRAHTVWWESMSQVIEGEAMALQWVLSSGFQFVIFETGSKILSDVIFRKKEDNFEFGSIFTEINWLLSLDSNFMVMFIRLQVNIVAHSLARAAIS